MVSMKCLLCVLKREAFFFGQIMEGDMPLGGLTLGLERRDLLLELGFAPLEGLYLERLDLAFQVQCTEFRPLTVEDPEPLAHLSIEGTVGGDDPGGLGNDLGAVVDQAIEAVVLAQVAEEVLLKTIERTSPRPGAPFCYDSPWTGSPFDGRCR